MKRGQPGTKVVGLMAAVILLATACDSDLGDDPQPGDPIGGGEGHPLDEPGIQVLANDLPGLLESNKYLDFVVDLPAPGRISYQVTDRSDTHPGHFLVAIVPGDQLQDLLNGRLQAGLAVREGAGTLQAAAQLAAGTHHVVVQCLNGPLPCRFSYRVGRDSIAR